MKPVVRTIPATQAKYNFGEVIRQVYTTREHLIVEKSGLPVIAIIPITDYEALQTALEGLDPGLRHKVITTSQLMTVNQKLRKGCSPSSGNTKSLSNHRRGT